MVYLNWLKDELEKIYSGVKGVYKLSKHPFIIKEMHCSSEIEFTRGKLKVEKQRLKYFQKLIPDNIPETSLILASDEEGRSCVYEIQKKIQGENLKKRNFLKKALDFLLLTKVGREYRHLSSFWEVDKYKGNFVWDEKRKKLFYVDLTGGIPPVAGD